MYGNSYSQIAGLIPNFIQLNHLRIVRKPPLLSVHLEELKGALLSQEFVISGKFADTVWVFDIIWFSIVSEMSLEQLRIRFAGVCVLQG